MRLVLVRYFHFIFVFMDAIKSELLNLTFQSDIMTIRVHIKLSSFYYKANALTNCTPTHHYLPNPIFQIYPNLP